MRISDWSSDVCSSDRAVDVRRQRAAEAEVVGAGLLLADRPAARVGRVRGEPGEQGGPADAGLHGDQAAAVVEGGDAVERTQVEHAPAGQELLPAHGV